MEQVEIFEKLSVVEARNRKAHDMDFVRTSSPFECTHLRQTHWIFAILTFPNRIASETPNPETIGSLPARKLLITEIEWGKSHRTNSCRSQQRNIVLLNPCKAL